jgi:hypothetical protein
VRGVAIASVEWISRRGHPGQISADLGSAKPDAAQVDGAPDDPGVEGANPIVINLGDTVLIPPNIKHSHGAVPDRQFIHLVFKAVNDEGSGTQWLEKVSDGRWWLGDEGRVSPRPPSPYVSALTRLDPGLLI